MKEVILLLTVLVMFIVCFFVMGKIGYFINENYKAFIIEMCIRDSRIPIL